ncbi:hypothetical protein PQX77_021511 [Marasmius sp. AFHP31]|nr:hypothetical protein PQX77_021511 [Marasmius sp. AFHP31]
MFNHSKSSRISGGTFSVVNGNQLNYYNSQSQSLQHSFLPGEEWKEDIYREYERTARGNLKLISTISETKVYQSDTAVDRMYGSGSNVKAKRVCQWACIVSGTQETQPSLLIRYTGKDAKKVFNADLLSFSRMKSPMLPQLRSFNDSDIPMVIFHDELIPAKQVTEGAKNSIEVNCYLKTQGEIARSNLLSSADSISLDPMEFECVFIEHIWIRPQTGQICLGPQGPRLRMSFLLDQRPRDSLDAKLPPLPLSMFNNLTILDPMVKNTPSRFMFSFDSEEWRVLRCAWLSQAAHVFNVLRTPREEWEDYALFPNDGVRLCLDKDIDHTCTPFECCQCVDTQKIDAPECYLFVLPPPQLPDTTPDVAAWCRTPAESLYYWSLDPTGDSKMPEAQRVTLGLPRFHQSIKTSGPICWKAKVYDLMQQWQEVQGFDPTTTDFAHSEGYPILEILPQNENRFEDCVQDIKGSKPEPESEGMEVDGCLETSHNLQGFLLSREYLEERSPMDVDMEDCSRLMANLHIEVTPMDE